MRGTTRKQEKHCESYYFNPRSPCGERLPTSCQSSGESVFQSTLPLRGTTDPTKQNPHDKRYFNPRSPCGERLPRLTWPSMSMWISIHAPLAGNDEAAVESGALGGISIHAPLAGNDLAYRGDTRRSANFNPRSPCGERLLASQWRAHSLLFQSTLPLRGTTTTCAQEFPKNYISIHAPLAGNDPSSVSPVQSVTVFQSTLPLRGTTRGGVDIIHVLDISIHAPLAGNDVSRMIDSGYARISIHAPLAGNDHTRNRHATRLQISIHAPLAGNDVEPKPRAIRVRISIHAPLAGNDASSCIRPSDPGYFNPRSPCGERLKRCYTAPISTISIHAPLAGNDFWKNRCQRMCAISIHAPLAGNDDGTSTARSAR